jgi:hypothetical protein
MKDKKAEWEHERARVRAGKRKGCNKQKRDIETEKGVQGRIWRRRERPNCASIPVGHGDKSMAQQLQMPSLQHGGNSWRPAAALSACETRSTTPLGTPSRRLCRGAQKAVTTLHNSSRPQ